MRRKYAVMFISLLSICLSANNSMAQNSPIAVERAVGHWEGVISREGKTWRTWLDIRPEKADVGSTADFPDYGLYAFPAVVSIDGENVRIRVLEGKEVASFEGKINGNEMSGEWTGLRMTATFNIKRTQAAPLDSYIVEDVQFQNGNAVLAGTLVRPLRAGAHPAVVFTHGSGNQTRSETFYRSRAFWFARNGIAALIYDRRGKGASEGDENVTWENLADDALAGVRMLKTRPDIDAKNIGISGFSQGGWVSPLAAARSNDVAFVLVGSAAAISPTEQNDYNVESLLRDIRVPEDKIKAVMDLRRRVTQFQMTGDGKKHELNEEIASLKSESWFRNTLLYDVVEPFDLNTKTFMSFDPAPVWGKVRVPVLALWGQQDLVVPATKSREIIDMALRTGKGKTFDLREFPKSGHGISVYQGKNEGWDFPRLVEGYQELMVNWTKKIAARRS